MVILDGQDNGGHADGHHPVSTQLYSHPLALTQLLLVYHLLRARQLDQLPA